MEQVYVFTKYEKILVSNAVILKFATILENVQPVKNVKKFENTVILLINVCIVKIQYANHNGVKYV